MRESVKLHQKPLQELPVNPQANGNALAAARETNSRQMRLVAKKDSSHSAGYNRIFGGEEEVTDEPAKPTGRRHFLATVAAASKDSKVIR